jgi:hypothetical protein
VFVIQTSLSFSSGTIVPRQHNLAQFAQVYIFARSQLVVAASQLAFQPFGMLSNISHDTQDQPVNAVPYEQQMSYHLSGPSLTINCFFQSQHSSENHESEESYLSQLQIS